MFNFRTIVVASAALSLISGASAAVAVKRNQEPSAPSCTDFTPFVYAGCFGDPSTPRALAFDSGLNTQNMTVETCVAFCKGNKYKYAGLEYYGQCFCGASVSGKAVSEASCNYPCTGNKGQVCGGSDIISVYQDPTFPAVDNTVISDYKPLGCYSEGTSGRSLAWPQDQVSSNTMTVESCLFACKSGGYSFAGVEYGSQCYCGEVLGNGTLPIPSTTCNMACNGNQNELCGGPSALNLYVATDLESNQPCNYVPPVVSSSSSSSPPPSIPTTTSTSSSPPPSRPTTTSSSSSPPPSRPTTTSSSSSPPPSRPTTTSSSSSPPPSKPTTTAPPPPATTSLCSSVVTVSPPAPTCEYKCGNFCSAPVPTFSDKNSCAQAVSSCAIQVASCFFHAGYPASLDCFKFSSWCNSLTSYCNNNCGGWGGKCSKSDCYNRNPPSGYNAPPSPVLSTSTFPCSAAATSTKPTTTSTTCPVPTASNICTQPHNPSKGYSNNSPVGSIPLPCLTCNNVLPDFQAGNCFKLYSVKDTNNCPSYGRNGRGGGAVSGCKAACDAQYNSCTSTYAQSCKGNWGWFGGDSYNTANWKCQQQWQDCYNANQGVNTGNRCNSWNQGWF